MYLGLFAGLLPFIILAAIMGKRGTVEFGLCKKHRDQRFHGILGGIIASVLGVAAFTVGVEYEVIPLIFVAIPVFFAGLIWWIMASRTLTPTKIDDRFLWLKGACPALLDTLQPTQMQ